MLRIGNYLNPVDRIKELADNLRHLESVSYGSYVSFNTCDFIVPISIAPISMIAFEKKLSFANGSSYLDTIRFPLGQEISKSEENVSTYFPLTRADLDGLGTDEIELKLRELIDKYVKLLKNNIINNSEFYDRLGSNASYLLISEMVDNIIEHSEANNAFIFSQFWNKTESCQICLVDNGIGIYNSLSKAMRDVSNNKDALRQVIEEQLSAKNEFGDQHRGTGIKNTIRLLSNNQLNGFFNIISGTSGYYVDSTSNNFFFELKDYSWNGTIVNMGFKKPPPNFDMYDYVR
ncbi:MAG: hypothetical protein LAT80_12865 [Balneolaceae bacterium]|nr:hypothetical protein [Balneolaceae bacterium]